MFAGIEVKPFAMTSGGVTIFPEISNLRHQVRQHVTDGIGSDYFEQDVFRKRRVASRDRAQVRGLPSKLAIRRVVFFLKGSKVRVVPERSPCPLLPSIETRLTAHETARFGSDRGPEFYVAALRYAQSLWLEAKPGRAILLIDRALGADVAGEDPVFATWPLPYAAMAWVLMHLRDDELCGNPRVHFQHLASRVGPPREEIRRWRAWACWHLCREISPHYAGDTRDPVREPDASEIAFHLDRAGIPKESALWRGAIPTARAVGEPLHSAAGEPATWGR
jgi:hypothetical protein